jgi:hypothetical protein
MFALSRADFLASLGSRASASLTAVSPGDIVSFRDKLGSEGRAVSTCNMVVKKILSVPFELHARWDTSRQTLSRLLTC